MNKPRLIRSSDLAPMGGDPRTLAKLSNSGALHRIRHGVYVRTAEWEALGRNAQYGLRAEAFQHRAPTQPVYCYATAALLWGLWVVGTPTQLHVSTSVTTGGRSRNGVTRRIGSPADGFAQCGQFLVTDKLTTTRQLINKLPFPYAVAVCDSSLRAPDRRHAVNVFAPVGTTVISREPSWATDGPQGPALTRDELRDAAQLLPTAAARARTLAVINFASALSGSAGESISRVKMHLYGFPTPILQEKFMLRDGGAAFVDFWFKELKLAGEFDGREKYSRSDWGGGLSMADRLWREKQREDQIRAHGVRMVRWTWQELMNRERFCYLLRQAGLAQK